MTKTPASKTRSGRTRTTTVAKKASTRASTSKSANTPAPRRTTSGPRAVKSASVERTAAPRSARAKTSAELDRVGSPEAKARFAPVLAALVGREGVSERGMFGARSLTRDGKGFAMLYKDQLVVKFTRERVAEYVARGVGVGWDPGHGRTMREWLAVPLSSSADWRALAEEAYALGGMRT